MQGERAFPSAADPTLAAIAGGRFSRSLLGYRRREVEGAIDSLEAELGKCSEEARARSSQLERVSGEARELRAGLTGAEGEVAALRSELARAGERCEQQLYSLAIIGRQLDELRTGARGQATRIRLTALREAAELSARVADAAEASPGSRRDRLLDALEGAIDRVAGEWEAEAPLPPLSRGRSRPDARHANGDGRSLLAGRRRVSVDVGPFEDFSQLVRFEDAANAIGATGDISIKRFSEGRARIDVALSEPVDLLRELEARCDLEFQVRSRADDELILDVDQQPDPS